MVVTTCIQRWRCYNVTKPLKSMCEIFRAGKTGHRVVFVSCQLRVVSNLGRSKPDPFNNRVKILRPKPDMKK